jgi:hypothetical protein
MKATHKSLSAGGANVADNFSEAMRKSIDYQKHIKPILERVLKGGLITVEGDTTDETAKLLDALSGIDLWMVDRVRGIRGVASRIQYDCNYQTFTIRAERESGAKTEFEKRKFAIDNDYLYPIITYQAYFNGQYSELGIAYTKDIIDYIEKGYAYKKKTKDDQKGQAWFWVVKWHNFKALGYKFVKEPMAIAMTA